MKEEILRLYQPNLTCSFDITMTDDNVLWNLVMKNKDNAGINDTQFVQAVWDFANHFASTMQKNKIFDVKKDEVLPAAHAFVTHDKRYVTWTIIVQAVEKPITLSQFIVNIAELTRQLAAQANIKLVGMPALETRSLDANP